MLSPKIQRNSMLPRKCAQPPWRNIESSALDSSPTGPGPMPGSKNRPGMNAAWFMKPSSRGPRVSSYAKTTALAPIRIQLTTGVRVERLRSRSGSTRGV